MFLETAFSQFVFTPDLLESCNTFEAVKCADIIFLIDITGLIDNSLLNRIAELADSLPDSSTTCDNRYTPIIIAVNKNNCIL